LGYGPFFALGRGRAWCDSRLVGLFVYFYFFSKGMFSPLLGDPYVCPRQEPPSLCSGVRMNLQRLVLPDGTFFPSRHCAIPLGCASAPVGVAPEALEESVHSCKVFSQCATGARGVCFSRPQRYFSRPQQCHAHVPVVACVRARLGGVAVCRAPDPGPVQGGRGELSILSVRPFTSLP
jgi:hypothetical protein